MKKAEEIIEKVKKISFPEILSTDYILGVLIAKYDLLRLDYLILQEKYDKLKKANENDS